ncbi:hypothetical protein [Micromonospora sp. NPDC005324]|uniref:hypothetical protein n=1 Tax=Micromonospora sp. NPDC005324 TaxID=3157033 RepID=UPI0033B8F52C
MHPRPAHSLAARTTTAPRSRPLSFRVPVAARLIHEDDETDIGVFENLLEEALGGNIRFDGCPGGHTLWPPGPADPHTERRLRVVAANAQVTVGSRHLVRYPTKVLTARLRKLRDYGLRLLDTPVPWQDTDAGSDEQGPLDPDHPDHDMPDDTIFGDSDSEDDRTPTSCVAIPSGLKRVEADGDHGDEEPGYDHEDDPADRASRRGSRTRRNEPRP